MPVKAARREAQRRRSVTVNRIKYTLGPLYAKYAPKITEEFIHEFSEINHADHTKIVEMIEAYEPNEIRYDAQISENSDVLQHAEPESVYPKAPEITVEPVAQEEVVQEQKVEAIKMLSSCNGNYNTRVSTKLNPNVVASSSSDYVPSRHLCVAYANTGKVTTQPISAVNVRLLPVQNKLVAA
jgi:hypothetical protein